MKKTSPLLLTALLCGPLLFALRPQASTTDAQEQSSGLQSDVSVDENVLLLFNRSPPASASVPLIQKSPLTPREPEEQDACLLNRLNNIDSQKEGSSCPPLTRVSPSGFR
jgi:hypothetical protein